MPDTQNENEKLDLRQIDMEIQMSRNALTRAVDCVELIHRGTYSGQETMKVAQVLDWLSILKQNLKAQIKMLEDKKAAASKEPTKLEVKT